jgi:hypothetical protein
MSEDQNLQASAEESQETQAEQSSEETQDDINNTNSEEAQEEFTEQSEESTEELTAKGTKLDPDPKSALHQQLANERRMREQYQQILNDPVLFERYAQQAGFTKAQAREAIEEKIEEFTPESFQSAEDIAKAFNKVASIAFAYKQEIAQLKDYLGSTEQIREQEALANRLQFEMSSAREAFPELDQKSPDYDQALVQDIVDEFRERGIDPQSQRLIKGQSFAKIAERLVKIARRAKGVGNEQAQKRVVEKTSGKIVTNKKSINNRVSESDMTPEQVIAERIKRVYG